MVPLSMVKPPAPNRPVPPTSSVVPVLSKVPARLTLPPPRPKWLAPSSGAAVVVPFRFSTPLLTLSLPALLQAVGLKSSVPPFTLSVPALLKTAGLMLNDCPGMSALMVPLLTMVLPAPLCVRLP